MKVKRTISIVLLIIWMWSVFYFSAQQGEGSGKTSKIVSGIVMNIIDIRKQIYRYRKRRNNKNNRADNKKNSTLCTIYNRRNINCKLCISIFKR